MNLRLQVPGISLISGLNSFAIYTAINAADSKTATGLCSIHLNIFVRNVPSVHNENMPPSYALVTKCFMGPSRRLISFFRKSGYTIKSCKTETGTQPASTPALSR